jgi:hypothetical protein
VPLYVTARGLSTSPIPYRALAFEVQFDLIEHRLVVTTSDGTTRSVALRPQAVADFYREYMTLLQSLGIDAPIRPVPSELDDSEAFPEDRDHSAYDPDYVGRCWRILARTARVLQEFRGRFVGKSSPVHFFWGAFDLACTRFSGRRAPTHPGGIPNLPDHVVREAYSHECISAGWWPGGGPLPEPGFYAYSYPEPAGFPEAGVQPEGAYYHSDLREFILPYEAVRLAPNPERVLLQFFQSSYQAGATLGNWDRNSLERSRE